ncbi:MAG: D-inositol-3-phosphate glycosyltransferase [Frankiales bacterium]|nr:D-inositol-3-phosphate glycosyltransferase [Frankiales bacterium]
MRGGLRSVRPRRAAVLSVHTSPLDQPGTGDAGGLNVYVVETAKRLADRGVEVEVFTRATSSDLPPVCEVAAGVTVRHLVAGPFEGLSKDDLPSQLCALTSGLLRVEAQHEPGYFDLIHSHYWLSGQVGWLAAERWGVPLVHSAHTLARVKNHDLAEGDTPEPLRRIVGEQQVVDAADRMVANTAQEARDLLELYGADAERVVTVAPGVDLEHFRLGSASAARTRLGVPPDAVLLLFVGRLQPLKAPDVLLLAAERLQEQHPTLPVHVAVVGGLSGSAVDYPEHLQDLASRLIVPVTFAPPADPDTLRDWYVAADLVAVPSFNESFGLVALEAQACGTPVVATRIGGLRTTVADGVSGLLVDGHGTASWTAALERALSRRTALSRGALEHAAHFSWNRTADGLLAAYREVLAAPLAATS